MHIGLDAREMARPDTGIGNYVVNLVRALARVDQKNRYTLFVEDTPKMVTLPSNFQVVCLARAAVDKWQDQWVVPRTAARLDLDLFHAMHHDSTPLLMRAPSILTVHDIAPMDFPNPSTLHRLYYRTLTGLAIRRARRVICISQSTQARISHHFARAKQKAVVVYYGRDEGFAPDPHSDKFAAIAAQVGIRAPYMLYVGSFMARKNIANLVAAVRRLQAMRPDVQMVFVGAPSGKDDYRFEGLKAPQVVFTGQMKDKAVLQALYSRAELLLFPSLYEGFGLPPLEAMACGCPVVTSTISSLPEVVGEAAVLVDPYNPEEIAAGALKILESSTYRAELSEHCLRQVQRFSWEKTAYATLAVYEQSLEQTRGKLV